ncbi:hypothetical protein [Pikeienuella sp. HZG-20]|uniref:hypothetical protein n=1 Tax=Paludibacillus litoralis TaxID=3133267 RepID=UPI0030EC0B90
MLDTITSTPAIAISPADWRETLTWGDIISFRFPVEGSDESPKKRPCLVLDIARLGERRYAMLAYGTSAYTKANHGYEIRLSKAEALASGLRRSTRFVGARRLLVSLDHPGIVFWAATGAPVMGRLSGDAFERMNRVRARIQAEADIAADHRSRRRKTQPARHRRTEPRPVKVEHRWPGRRRPATST